MILRSIIIDDEPMGINSLKTLIEVYISDVKVVAESTSAGEAIELIENYKPEIVFLDINMPEMSGFELLEKLRWKNFSLVFITAHQQYALKALKNNAVDYLLKPVDYEELQAAVAKIQKQQLKKESTHIVNYSKLLHELDDYYYKNKMLVNLKSGIEAVDLDDVIYLESKSNYTRLHLSSGKIIITSKTLKEFEDQLCLTNLPFMRVHKSFIINLKRVTKYMKSEDIILLDDTFKIPLSRSKKDVFYTWLNI
jgi:two-component system LytT family response regulator